MMVMIWTGLRWMFDRQSGVIQVDVQSVEYYCLKSTLHKVVARVTTLST